MSIIGALSTKIYAASFAFIFANMVELRPVTFSRKRALNGRDEFKEVSYTIAAKDYYIESFSVLFSTLFKMVSYRFIRVS